MVAKRRAPLPHKAGEFGWLPLQVSPTNPSRAFDASQLSTAPAARLAASAGHVPLSVDPPTGESAQVNALLYACLRLDAGPSSARELGRRIGEVGWDALLAYADELLLGSVLGQAIRRLQLAPPLPMTVLPDGRVTIAGLLAQREASHLTRRAVLAERLTEIAAALASEGIAAVALKGGRSIVTGTPDWRYLRDLDLLVAPQQARKAQDVLLALGYRPADVPRSRLVHHHLHELYRDDLPGWIEVHRRAGTSRVEQFMSSAELLAAADWSAGIGVLPPHLHVLHGMIHHHIGHRAVKRATIAAKGLYEFAAEMTALSDIERETLLRRAARHPRLLAVLEFWTAAAVEQFGMAPEASLPVAEDIWRWWCAVRDSDPEAGGIGLELSAATNAGRMRRAVGGQHMAKRLYWRLSVPLSFLKRPVLPMPVGRQEPEP